MMIYTRIAEYDSKLYHLPPYFMFSMSSQHYE
jgi:hypothetical protein